MKNDILGQNLKKSLDSSNYFYQPRLLKVWNIHNCPPKKLKWKCQFLPWVNFVRGDLCQEAVLPSVQRPSHSKAFHHVNISRCLISMLSQLWRPCQMEDILLLIWIWISMQGEGHDYMFIISPSIFVCTSFQKIIEWSFTSFPLDYSCMHLLWMRIHISYVSNILANVKELGLSLPSFYHLCDQSPSAYKKGRRSESLGLIWAI